MASNNMQAQLAKLTAQLKAYEKQVRAAASKAVAEHAHDIAEKARELAPVDTGHLRDSIDVVKVDELTYKVEVTADYAADVELGTADQVAEPFLFPAAEQLRNGLPDKVKKALKNG